jgi:hypothetical protein
MVGFPFVGTPYFVLAATWLAVRLSIDSQSDSLQNLGPSLSFGCFLRCRQQAVQPLRRVLLQGGHDVAVDVHGGRVLAMAEHFHNDSCVLALRQHQRRAGVAKIVEAQARQSEPYEQSLEAMGYVLRVQRRASTRRKDQARVNPLVPRTQTLL